MIIPFFMLIDIHQDLHQSGGPNIICMPQILNEVDYLSFWHKDFTGLDKRFWILVCFLLFIDNTHFSILAEQFRSVNTLL